MVQEFFSENQSSRSETSSISEGHSSLGSQNESESCYELLSPKISLSAGKQTSETKSGQDLWKQMKLASIPAFNGDKTKFDLWKAYAAFMTCIDKAPATKAYKLLQLRQYVSGEALNCIEKLGYLAMAYDTALQRLERKFGGNWRQVALYLEELENFYQMKGENV